MIVPSHQKLCIMMSAEREYGHTVRDPVGQVTEWRRVSRQSRRIVVVQSVRSQSASRERCPGPFGHLSMGCKFCEHRVFSLGARIGWMGGSRFGQVRGSELCDRLRTIGMIGDVFLGERAVTL
jgi:hypothetical protein